MPTHWSSRKLHIVSTSSSTTTQLLHAVGCAEAGRYFSHHPEAAAKAEGDYRAFHEVEFHADEVAFTSLGEGSTSQGEFWEALNTASNQKLPVVFCVEDNGYAISVPVEVNTPGGNISKLVANFPNFYFAEVDGTDPEACLRVFQAAVAYCRAGMGPAFVHGHWFGRIRIRFPTTTSFTAPLPSAKPMPCAIRWPKMQMRLLREGILTDERSTHWSRSRPGSSGGRGSARWKLRCRRSSEHSSACLLRRSGSYGGVCKESAEAAGAAGGGKERRGGKAKCRARWRTSSTPACMMRCGGIRALLSTAKMWPMPAEKLRSPK